MISRTGVHAVRALVCLARLPSGSFAGAAALARQIGAPPNYLAKLLQTMTRARIVESRKGPAGGFRLIRPAADVRLLDIIDPIENVSLWDGCFLGAPTCSKETACPVHDRWAELRDGYLALLSETTLDDLAGRCPDDSGPDDSEPIRWLQGNPRT